MKAKGYNSILVFISLLFAFYNIFAEKVPPGNSANPESYTNSIGMKFRLLKAGEFEMGSENGGEDEKPIHTVLISQDFYLAESEVTQAQYKKVMGINPSHFKDADFPVDTVSWNDAQEFCNKLSQTENREYRLPTEAEWEYACRAGTKTEYFWGDKFDVKHAFIVDNTKGKPQQAASTKPNPWGLYDMSGNVWEWCQDWYSDKTYKSNPEVDPQGAAFGQFKVIRGGSWDYCNMCCRSAYRGSRDPGCKSSGVGFRVVLVPKK
jgi:formylglycine-generating enzyme required for sulfatase activity